MGDMFTVSFLRANQTYLLWLIPLLPLIGAAVNGIFGKKIQDRLGKRAIHVLSCGVMVLASLVALYAFFGQLLPREPGHRALVHSLGTMLQVGRLHIDLALYMDPLSGVMTLIVTLIGTLIHIYSTGYMHAEKSYWRFFAYLNLFIFSMLLLVLGDSFLLMFFGWEGVGLCSYLLIGFWYTDLAKARAGMKAFVVNRVGDFAFLTGMFLLFWSLAGSWTPSGRYIEPHRDQATAATTLTPVIWIDPSEERVEGTAPVGEEIEIDLERITGPTLSFAELHQQMSLRSPRGEHVSRDNLAGDGKHRGKAGKTVFGIPVLFLVCVFFFIGACGKSAQLPLYVWLPDAMAGPTPVSALIHAATMVTAGVYMVARLNFLFYLSPGAMTVVATVGGLTALYAATIGLFQYDIKKVLAYSTISQLGYMFLGVGVGAWWAGIFHLLTHAAFKACLFLGSGSVIHGMHYVEHHGDGHGHGDSERDPRLTADPHDPQDMRNMGGLAALMPWTRRTYLIACFAIAGFPWAAGFYSKDEILWKAMSNGSTLIPGWFLWGLGFCGAGLTAFYMFRSYYMTFYFRAPSEAHKEHVKESPASMTYVLWALAGLSIATLLLGIPALWLHREPWLEKFFAPVMSLAPFRARIHSVPLEWLFMAASVGIAGAGWLAARFLYLDGAKTTERMEAWKARFAPVHKLVFNKYWVDEIYQATFVKGTLLFSRCLGAFDKYVIDGMVNSWSYIIRGSAWLSGWIDRTFVDGAVNGVATLVIRVGRAGRRIQTGRINQYVLGVVVGVIVLSIVTTVVR
jgi:NADH-quinone oxidoreductase subunit L